MEKCNKTGTTKRNHSGFFKWEIILLSIIVSFTVFLGHASAQTPTESLVPTDYVLDIQQGENQLQEDPKASQVAKRIILSEFVTAFENNVAIPLKEKITQSEATESIVELEPTPLPEEVVPQEEITPSTETTNQNQQQQTQEPSNSNQYIQEPSPTDSSQSIQNTDLSTQPTSSEPSPSVSDSNQIPTDTPTPTPEDIPTQSVQGVSTGPNIVERIILGIKRTYYMIIR